MAYYFIQGLIVLINFYVCIGTNVKTKRGLVNPAFEEISEITHVIDEIDSDGVVNCMMVCSYNVNCRSVSYNNLDSRCRLFSQDLFGQAPTGHNEKGWIHLDLTTVLPPPVDCSDFQSRGYNSSGLYTIGRNQVTVWCDLETDGGGWTVFQRRSDGSVDFHRNWNDYVAGFGDTSREYWIDNNKWVKFQTEVTEPSLEPGHTNKSVQTVQIFMKSDKYSADRKKKKTNYEQTELIWAWLYLGNEDSRKALVSLLVICVSVITKFPNLETQSQCTKENTEHGRDTEKITDRKGPDLAETFQIALCNNCTPMLPL